MSAYARQVLLDSPLAYWPMDDASSGFKDASGNSRDLTVDFGTPGYRAGLCGPGLVCPTGAAYRAVRSATGALDPGSGDFLWTGWYRSTYSHPGTDQFELLFAYDTNESGAGLVVYTTDTGYGTLGGFRVWCVNSVLNTANAYNDGRFHYLWVERRSNVLSIYVDNVLDGSATRSGSISGYGIRIAEVGTTGVGYGLDASSHLGHQAWWAGTIPSASRRTVHFEAGRRSATVASGGYGG